MNESTLTRNANMPPLPEVILDDLTPPVDFAQGRRLKTTRSLCPVCLRRISADVFERGGQVWMDKTCPAHGPFSALLASDSRHYYLADPRVEALGSCCGAARHCGDQFANHSCSLLIEITQRCNLTCPTCYADSSPDKEQFLSLAEFEALLDGLLDKGKSDANIIQLSGGEPTIHPQFFEIVDAAITRGVKQVYVNTNGIRLANRDFAERIASRRKKVTAYLQFDGFKRSTLELLRGRGELLETKMEALDRCEEFDLQTVPVMTLTRGINDDELGKFLLFAVSRPRCVRMVMIQPAMYSGRYNSPRRVDRLTVADVARKIAEQTKGLFREDDFTPIPCSDPNCFALAVALRGPNGLVPVSRYLPRYHDWANEGNRDLTAAVIDTVDAGDLFELVTKVFASGALDALEEKAVDELLDMVTALQAGGHQGGKGLFAIGVKPFMDAYTFDQDRIDKCCIHIVSRDGSPVSFCEYNALNRPLGKL